MIQLDYYYPLGQQEIKGLSVVDTTTGCGFSTMLRYKGAQDAYAVAAVVEFLDELRYPEIILQPDGELALGELTGQVLRK